MTAYEMRISDWISDVCSSDLLYSAVTEYVRNEMNRVQRFAEEEGRKRNSVGFALQILQRRLASSPAAIYQSLKRRRERLESQLAEARLAVKGRQEQLGSEERKRGVYGKRVAVRVECGGGRAINTKTVR